MDEKETLKISTIDYLENLTEVSSGIAAEFKEGIAPTEENIEVFNKVMEGMGVVFEALITQLVSDNDIAQSTTGKFMDLIRTFNETLQNKDFMTLGDIIEFELLPLQKEWIDIIK